MLSEEIRKYLPQYLSKEDLENLFNDLEEFPHNHSRFFTTRLSAEEVLFQGDGLEGLLTIMLPSDRVEERRGIVLSNTCDIDPSNVRKNRPVRLVHAPICNLEKYEKMLRSYPDSNVQSIEDHLASIRNQHVTNAFYIPNDSKSKLGYEGVVFFDDAVSLPNNYIHLEDAPKKRLFSLSDYGFYVFAFKLSIHFTRLQEGISRSD